jgi:phosphoribosyl-AMP cyclohydrolase
MTERNLQSLDDLAFGSGGLIPAIAQDQTTGDVLMLGYMTRETLDETLASGRMVYWSRSRQARWAKGDTSGDVQIVKDAFYDCDGDVLLFKVDQHGAGACVTKHFTCFYRPLSELAEDAPHR